LNYAGNLARSIPIFIIATPLRETHALYCMHPLKNIQIGTLFFINNEELPRCHDDSFNTRFFFRAVPAWHQVSIATPPKTTIHGDYPPFSLP